MTNQPPAGASDAAIAGWIADGDTIPADLITVTRDAIFMEFGNNGTDGYYKRILVKIFAAITSKAEGVTCPRCNRTVSDEWNAITYLAPCGRRVAGDKNPIPDACTDSDDSDWQGSGGGFDDWIPPGRDRAPPAQVAGSGMGNVDWERQWREGWAYSYSGWKLYGDDGELQDNSVQPFIDWRKDSPGEIRSKIAQRSKAQAAITAQPAPSGKITIRCPKCKKTATDSRRDTDYHDTDTVEIVCPDCDDGDFHSELHFDASGKTIERDPSKEPTAQPAPVVGGLPELPRYRLRRIEDGGYVGFELERDDQGPLCRFKDFQNAKFYAALSARPAVEGDGWAAMTNAVMDMKLRHVDNHNGDIYHGLQALIVKFGKPWDGKLTNPVAVKGAQGASGGEAEGLLNVIDLLRTGNGPDGKPRKFAYAQTRTGSMVEVDHLFTRDTPPPATGERISGVE